MATRLSRRAMFVATAFTWALPSLRAATAAPLGLKLARPVDLASA